MKKTISIILAFVLVLSTFAFGASAAETNKTEALFAKLNSAKEVTVTLKAGDVNLFGFLRMSATDTVYIKDNKVAYEYNAGFLSARAIYDGDNICGILPMLPFFYVKLDASVIGKPDVWSLIEGASNITLGILRYLKSYNETVDGVEYYVEEFDDRAQVTSKFYYVGDTLKMLKVTDAQTGSIQYTYFENISFTVDDSVFTVPEYAFDLSILLKGLVAGLLKNV